MTREKMKMLKVNGKMERKITEALCQNPLAVKQISVLPRTAPPQTRRKSLESYSSAAGLLIRFLPSSGGVS